MTDRQTNRPTDRQTDRQTDRLIDTRTRTHTHTHSCVNASVHHLSCTHTHTHTHTHTWCVLEELAHQINRLCYVSVMCVGEGCGVCGGVEVCVCVCVCVYSRTLPIRSTASVTCVWVRGRGVTRSARPHTLAYTSRSGVALDLKTLA